tara:strand:- start:203 stop:1441 length:1239 start_codon:yes stop_codon:yes gene_type:complete
MGAQPRFNKDFNLTERVISPEARANLAQSGNKAPCFDDFCRMNVTSAMSKSFMIAKDSVADFTRENGISKQILAAMKGFDFAPSRFNDDASRVNAFGEFFTNQLSVYMPSLFVTPTRGLSYMALPMISYGAGKKDFNIPGYDWNSTWQRTAGSPTVGTPNVNVIPKTVKANIHDYSNSIELHFDEQLAMAETMAKKQSGGYSYDPFAGTFAAIPVKFIALSKSYQLAIDELAWNGRLNEDSALGEDGLSLTADADIPSFTYANIVPAANASLAANTANTVRQILAGGQQTVASQSKGNFTANVLYIDLSTYSSLIAKTDSTLDTNPLQYLILNDIYDAIIPVPAWNAKGHEGKSTFMAAFVDPQVMFFNNALPMVQTGVGLAGDAIQMKYRFRSSGMTVVNSLAIARCVGDA